jgi:flagellar hook-associated protein 3 FlgL
MRISTDSIYQNQTQAIDNLAAQEAIYGNQLSTGKSLNVPGDDPTQIAQDLSVRSDIGVQTQVGNNLSNVSSELTTVDGTLSSLTSVLQSARSLAIQGASDTNTASQLQEMAIQVGQLLQQSIGFANTQYAGTYVFAGTASPSSPPVTANATATVVSSTGNEVAQNQKLPNGQTITSSVTLQQAFNFNAPDGSPSVFQVLQTLYNTLNTSTVVDSSAVQVNVSGAALTAGTTILGLESPALTALPLTLDNGTGGAPPTAGPSASISISSASAPNGVTFSFNPVGPPPDTITSIVAAINAQTATTGVTAAFNLQTQKFSLTSSNGPFTVTDVPTPGTGATTTGNLVETLGLTNQADIVNTLSTQIADIDNATQVMLSARAQVGSTIQQVTALQGVSSSQVTNDTATQSGIEDTNVPQATTNFSLTQTALQAAYGTTSQLEQKDLFDYISTS